MERRFLLATVLSVFILWAWSVLIPRPKIQLAAINNTQHIDTNSVKINNYQKLSTTSSPPLPTPLVGIEEKIERIETDKLIVEFSNKGGIIRQISLKEYGIPFPVHIVSGVAVYGDQEFRLDHVGDREIAYIYSRDGLNIQHSYKISENDYTIEMRTEISPDDNMSILNNLNEQSFVLDMSSLDKNNHEYLRDRSLFEYVVSFETGTIRKNNAYKFAANERKEQLGEISWVGFRNRYFCLILKPLYKTSSATINPMNDNMLQINMLAEQMNVESTEKVVFLSFIFAGPEKPDLLKQHKFGFEEIQRYYRLTLFDAIAKIIYSVVDNIHKIIPNWGICILLISVIIYFAVYPLTLRSMLSMRKMQAVQPKITALREKHKDNPQKLNAELLELYKKNKINPMGGCLPMLLQMPVFIGLYQVLWRSVSLKGADFWWIKDLSQPDRLAILPFSLPFFGNEINLLPIIMVFVMAIQQKITSKSMVITDPAQATQQKMMTIMMPVVLGVVFYQFASGLTLYFTAFYALSTFTQWKMSKMPSPA